MAKKFEELRKKMSPRAQARAEKLTKKMLAGLGRKGTNKRDLSRFVDEAVQTRLFELIVRDAKKHNRQFSQEEIMGAIEEALGGA